MRDSKSTEDENAYYNACTLDPNQGYSCVKMAGTLGTGQYSDAKACLFDAGSKGVCCMRDALQRYFQNANALRVQFSKMDIVVEGDEALATFTRTDDFTDAASRLPVHLEVRVSNVVTREATGWKIRGIKKGT